MEHSLGPLKDFSFKLYSVVPQLRPFIKRIWSFEYFGKSETSTLPTIAPNGEVKIIYSLRKNMRSIIAGVTHDHVESRGQVVGLHTVAGRMDWDSNYGSLGIDFFPQTACRFFRFPLSEITGRIVDLQEIMGKTWSRIADKLESTLSVDAKVDCIQQFLIDILSNENLSSLSASDYAVLKIIECSGMNTINSLSEITSYSRRHLDRIFLQNVGLAPKAFANVIKFDRLFKGFTEKELENAIFLDFYYDQPHFSKTFKSMIGLTPREYLRSKNLAHDIFYQ